MAFRKYGMFLVTFTRTQLLRGTAECMHPLRNPATYAVLRSAIKRRKGRSDRQSQVHLNQFIARALKDAMQFTHATVCRPILRALTCSKRNWLPY